MAFYQIGCILRLQHPFAQPPLLGLLAVGILAGCGRPAADPPVQIRITPAAATLAPGASLTLVARCHEATGSLRPCPPLTWSLENGSLLTVDGSDTVRQFTAGDPPGVLVVRASSGVLGTLAAITVVDGRETANLTIRSSERHQTLRGWEAAVSAGWRVSPRAFEELATRAASELGLTRMRMEVTGNQVETRTDLRGTCGNSRRIAGVNDNADPNMLDPAGFNWHCLDEKVTDYILPFKRAVEARGERFTLNACYVGFMRSSAFQQEDPAEYAELVLATLDHLRTTFGLVPDLWETRLEPDAGQVLIDGTQVGRLIAAAGARASAAGYTGLRFSLPSTKVADNALPYFADAMRVPGAAPFVAEIVYHRYRAPSSGTLTALADAGRSHGLETAMLEYLNATEHDLWADLTAANVSSWEKYALAGPLHSAGRGNQLYYADIRNDRFLLRPATYPLIQYFRFLRPGFVRVGTSSTTPGVEPVAFVTPAGAIVLVVNLPGQTPLHVAGLPPGTYQVSYSSPAAPGATGLPITIKAGGILSTSLPANGTVTIGQ